MTTATGSLYAHTSIQLFEQLRRDGYTGEGLQRILRAHELAQRLFACRFQYTGVPFLVHVIGTASVLSSLAAPADLVAAGLLHNVYGNGDFGDARKGVTERKREVVRRAIGASAEEYVHAFRLSLPWKPAEITEMARAPDALSPFERGVVLVRLADLVEHYRDLGALYGGRRERARETVEQVAEAWLRLANAFAGPQLAATLQGLFDETLAADLPDELSDLTGRKRSFALPPRSYRRRLPVALREEATRIRNGLARRLAALLRR